MRYRKFLKSANGKPTTISRAFHKKSSGRTFGPTSANGDHDISSPASGHNFGNVQVEHDQSFKQPCPLSLTGPDHCPFGGACHTCPSRGQTELTVNKSEDKFEQEADRMASYVVNETSYAPQLSSRERSVHQVQRQESKKPPTEEEKYKEAAIKTGEAFLETPVGKQITGKAKELGEDFVSTLPGKIITGAAAAGVVGAIVAKNAEVPIQAPEIPLDKVTPGLSMKITYKGPVRKPTDASIVFTYKIGGGKQGRKKQAKTKSEQFREETARMAHEQHKFRESLKTPEQKAGDEAFMQWYILHKTNDPASPIYIPNLVPRKEGPMREEKKEEEKTLLQRKKAGSLDAAAGVPSIVHDELNLQGQPLEPETRSLMESRFGCDFSKVKVHAGPHAAKAAHAANAQAFTVGRHIVFGASRYTPHARDGHKLLAHELSHVVQQRGAVKAGNSKPKNTGTGK